ALALDPQLQDAIGNLVILQVEGGDLGGALEKSSGNAAARPNTGRARFVFAYVLRYAGFLEDAARECEAAWAIDSRDPYWRSCYATFMLLGRGDRARDFLRLDGDTLLARITETDVAVGEGKVEQTLALLKGNFDRPILREYEACLTGKEGPDDDARYREALAEWLLIRDPEARYFTAGRVAFCGHEDVALTLLASAIDGNYLAGPALDTDPTLARIRQRPEFARI